MNICDLDQTLQMMQAQGRTISTHEKYISAHAG